MYTKIAYIIKPHGLKGDLTIGSEPWALEQWAGFKTVFLFQMGTYVPFPIESVAPLNKGKLKVKLLGINDAAKAETLRSQDVYQLTEALKIPQQVDIRGYALHDANGASIGVVTDVDEDRVQPLLVIDRNGEDLLIPFVEDWILEIDKDKCIIQMELPEGLIAF